MVARRRCLFLVFVPALFALLPALNGQAPASVAVPAPAQGRVAATQLRVAPDRPDWTYQPGQPVTFRVSVTWDQHPLPGATIRYRVGPEMFEGAEISAQVPPEGLLIAGGTLREPGFLRCLVTTTVDGRTYRGVATAGFAPERIAATQQDPADFDAFWTAQKTALARLPLDARLTLQPELCTSTVEVFHLSLQTSGSLPGTASRVYGMLCVPRGPGPFPALLNVPGAGIRPYRGQVDLADKGFITLQIGIHGIPVNLPQELYDQLSAGALQGYNTLNLDQRDVYYYKRVYLACVRANDFLTSHAKWDRRTLIVLGGSQGGQLSIATAALDSRVTALAANYPAYSDVTGYLHHRAGGWPHMMRPQKDGRPSVHATEAKIATTAYYDAVNFARRLKVPGFYSWGYNDEVCPVTSLYAAYNQISAPKSLLLTLEQGHATPSESWDRITAWVAQQVR